MGIGQVISWCGEGRLEKPEVPNARRPAVISDEAVVDGENGIEREPTRLSLHLPSSRSVFR